MDKYCPCRTAHPHSCPRLSSDSGLLQYKCRWWILTESLKPHKWYQTIEQTSVWFTFIVWITSYSQRTVCRRGWEYNQQTELTFPQMTTNLSSYIKPQTDAGRHHKKLLQPSSSLNKQTPRSRQWTVKYNPENLPGVLSSHAARLLLFKSFKRHVCKTSQLLWHCPLTLLCLCNCRQIYRLFIGVWFLWLSKEKGSKHTWNSNVRIKTPFNETCSFSGSSHSLSRQTADWCC